MSDTPKFEVIDRRKFKAEEEQESARTQAPKPDVKQAETHGGPQLVVNESGARATTTQELPGAGAELDEGAQPELPPEPSAEESRELKSAYEASSQRLEDIVRAQNPAMGVQPPVGFEHLVQQLYISAMIQMGAGAQQGERPRVDILGAKTTIDMMAVLAEKTKGNLTEAENRALQTVLFEARIAFNELCQMITIQGMQGPPPPPPTKR